MTTLKFKPVKKDRLFYNRFKYCLGFYINEASCLRILDHDYIDDMIERRKQWQEIARQRWVNGKQKHGITVSRSYIRDITEKTTKDLHALAEMLLNTTADFKLVVSMHHGYVYTNDTKLIDQLNVMAELTQKTYTKAKISRSKNTIQLKNPQHSYRSYFKTIKLSGQQKDQLMDFLHNQTSQVRIGPALGRWFDVSFNRTQDYFFIDHSTENWLTMLSLVCPGLIRKTMQIQQAK